MEKKCQERFNIKLANRVVCVEYMNDYVREYCKDYITDETAEFTISITNSDIAYEREKAKSDDIRAGISIRVFSEEYLEILAVYRKIVEKFIEHDIVLFHGSVIAVDGMGYLFTAKSGTGKSTHTRLWREQFGSRVVMVNDDKPLLKITDEGVFACGTPWNGKHRLSTNTSAPLKAICVLTRDKVNHIEEIEPREAYQMLLQQIYRPADKAAVAQTLKLIDGMMKHMRFYRLGCNMEPEAAKVAFEGMNGELK